MKCPECTNEMEKIALTQYNCSNCKWKGMILSQEEMMRAAELAIKHENDPQRMRDEILNEFSKTDKGV
jgi:hypothetical protein